MRNQHHRIAAALVLSACICLPATAQRLSDRISENSIATVCRSGSTASRLKDGCDYLRTEKIELEIERTTVIELSVNNTPFCSAQIGLEYYQRNTIAHVEGTLENDVCAASGGKYVVSARVRNSEGETVALDFEEQWQRSDDQPIEINTDYPIGENVELLRLRARGVTCRCEDTDE